MRDDTPTFAAEEAHAHAHAPEWARADLPEPDELDYLPPSDAPLTPEWEAHLRESQRIVADLGGAS